MMGFQHWAWDTRRQRLYEVVEWIKYRGLIIEVMTAGGFIFDVNRFSYFQYYPN